MTNHTANPPQAKPARPPLRVFPTILHLAALGVVGSMILTMLSGLLGLGVGLLIADACIVIVERGFGKSGALWFNLAQVAGLALGMVFRFTTYKRWVFVSPERAAARAVAEGSVAEVDDGRPQSARSRTRVSS